MLPIKGLWHIQPLHTAAGALRGLPWISSSGSSQDVSCTRGSRRCVRLRGSDGSSCPWRRGCGGQCARRGGGRVPGTRGARDGGRGGDGAYILWQEKSRLSQESKQLPAKVCGKQQHKAPSLAPSQSSPFGNSRRSTTTVRTLPQPALLFPSLPATSTGLCAAARLP